jgi:hypothetical protein
MTVTATGPDLVARAAEVQGMLTVLAGRGSPHKPTTGDDAVRLTARIFLGAGVIPNEIRPFAAACPVLGEIADAMDAAKRLRVTCEAAVRHIPCGLDGCGAHAGMACDGETGAHVVRLGSAMKRRVITGGQLVEALQSAVVFTGSTIIRPDGA